MNIAEQTREEFRKFLEERGIKAGFQEDGSYLDPVYGSVAVKSTEICPQEVNPNFMTDKSFEALLTSIIDNGYCFPILIAKNPMYDPSTAGQTKPLCFTGQSTVDVRDPEVRKFYPYTAIDGCHRIMASVLGSPEYDGVVKSTVQRDMTKEIFNRTGGYIPVVIIEGKTEQELMSAEILFNQARGSHDISEMKNIVCDLLRSGMSQQWISQKLFLDPSAITRFAQLGGISAAFNTDAELGEAWDPIKDRVAERRKNIDTVQAARRYVRKYRTLKGFENTVAADESINIIEAAKALGFDPSEPRMMPKSLDESGKVFEKELEGEESENVEV